MERDYNGDNTIIYDSSSLHDEFGQPFYNLAPPSLSSASRRRQEHRYDEIVDDTSLVLSRRHAPFALSADTQDDPLHRPTSFSWRSTQTDRWNAPDLAQQPPAPIYYHNRNNEAIRDVSAQTPVIRGIPLVSTSALPDRFRNVFPFPLFNAVQSKCFQGIYNTEDNFVLSSPTGSGKTAMFELAICRLVNTCLEGSFKVVCQAPTRALCAERLRDWQNKFTALNISIAELTGDVQNVQFKNVQHATVIITTPEKWDSITRKWKDHKKLMQMVKLFLVDEVHSLKEDRGAVLEVVVSRMKSVGSGVRFIALSATIPNIQDISDWLGRSPEQQHLPALQETFGEEFRPVRITKHVCGYHSKGNDFAFDKSLNERLPEVISKYTEGKPIMIFCFTRSACLETAKYLTDWLSTTPRHRQWRAPSSELICENKDLNITVKAGVAFDHAGLSAADRKLVEKGYLAGNIHVICCTSTLAVGVNLPCHMVIIKNTVTYAHASRAGCKEYSDLEVMQMLGRAGRPQFGHSAVAVIMTRQQQVTYYERLVSGQETIESRLHLNLIDHLNAEVGLGTIYNEAAAMGWLRSTFLYIRLEKNLQHYKLSSDRVDRLDEHLKTICTNGIRLLQQHDLVTKTIELYATAFGDAMSRYCVQFETMQNLMSLKRGARTSEILTAISQAAEFKEIYFRAGEKNVYRQWNHNPLIKFPLNVHIDAPWHKVFLIIQVVLAGSELPDAHREQRQDFSLSKLVVFQHALRLVRCICDCLIHLKDANAARNAFALARSLCAQIWDDSTLHMCQLDGLGMAGVRKLVRGGVKTMDELASAEPHRLEQILTRNPPYGSQLREKAESFPRLSVDLETNGSFETRTGECILLRIVAKLALLNATPPTTFRRKALHLCLLVDTSAGQPLHFSRFSATQMIRDPAMSITLRLTRFTDTIRAQVMCEDYAGNTRSAVLKLRISQSTFQAARLNGKGSTEVPNPNIHDHVEHLSNLQYPQPALKQQDNEFDDDAIEDQDMMQVDDDDDFVTLSDSEQMRAAQEPPTDLTSVVAEPIRLDNGRWQCRHNCKDKSSCKHLCCREGLEKRPQPAKSISVTTSKTAEKKDRLQQSQLKITRKRSACSTDQTALTQVVQQPATAVGERRFSLPTPHAAASSLHNEDMDDDFHLDMDDTAMALSLEHDDVACPTSAWPSTDSALSNLDHEFRPYQPKLDYLVEGTASIKSKRCNETPALAQSISSSVVMSTSHGHDTGVHAVSAVQRSWQQRPAQSSRRSTADVGESL